jgi:MshEN domain
MSQESATILAAGEPATLSGYQVVKTSSDMERTIRSFIAAHITEVAVVKATLHFVSAGKRAERYQEQAHQSMLYFLHNLRSLVRKTDSVLLLDHALYFILPGASSQGGSIVEERLWDALLWRIHNAQEVSEIDVLLPETVTMGRSSCTWPCDSIEAVLQAAHEIRRHFTLPHHSSAPQARKEVVEQDARQSEDSQLRSQARELGIPYLTFLPRKSATKVRHLLNPQLALELHCYPLGRERDMLTVAMLNPQDRSALDRLHQETGLHIFPVLAPHNELQTALEQLV